MIGSANMGLSKLTRVFARLTIALCLLACCFASAVERGFSSHLGAGSALAMVATGETASGDHDGGSDRSGVEIVDHGCHGCAVIAQRAPQAVSTPIAFDERTAWASVPSTDGAEPLIDLPPPRA